MAVAATSAISQLQAEVDRVAGDPTLDPAQRVADLRGLREDLAFLVGTCDRYMADQELRREGDAMGRVQDRLLAREGADVRGVMLDRAMAAPEQLDAAGLPSHRELDERDADGTLAEAIVGITHPFDAARHPRGRGGKFAGSGRVVPRGRKGNTLTAPGHAKPHDRPLLPGEGQQPQERPLFLGGVRTSVVRRVLGAHRDTKDKYSVSGGEATPGTTGEEPRVYSAERAARHKRWIEELFADGGRGDKIAATPVPEGERQAAFVGGGPASGKSSADAYMPDVGTAEGRKAAEGRDDVPEDRKKLAGSVEIDQDWFKKKIDEYRELAEAKDPYASDAAHREAADVAAMALAEAKRRGFNIVAQGTGDSGPGNAAGRMSEAMDQGYKVHAFYVSAPTEVALERAKGRAAETGRAVPEAGLRAMHANVSRFFPEVEALAPRLASLQLLDSREDTRKGGQARLMEHMDPETRKIVEDRPDLLHEFREKQNEDPGTLITSPNYV